MKNIYQFIFGILGLALSALFIFSIMCAPKLGDNYLVLNAIFMLLMSGEVVLVGIGDKRQKKVSFDDVMCCEIAYQQLKSQVADVEGFITSVGFNDISQSRKDNAFNARAELYERLDIAINKLHRLGIYPS